MSGFRWFAAIQTFTSKGNNGSFPDIYTEFQPFTQGTSENNQKRTFAKSP